MNTIKTTLIPKIGKQYICRDGRKTSKIEPNVSTSPYPFMAIVNGERQTWNSNGYFSSSLWNAPLDLVEEIYE